MVCVCLRAGEVGHLSSVVDHRYTFFFTLLVFAHFSLGQLALFCAGSEGFSIQLFDLFFLI